MGRCFTFHLICSHFNRSNPTVANILNSIVCIFMCLIPNVYIMHHFSHIAELESCRVQTQMQKKEMYSSFKNAHEKNNISRQQKKTKKKWRMNYHVFQYSPLYRPGLYRTDKCVYKYIYLSKDRDIAGEKQCYYIKII